MFLPREHTFHSAATVAADGTVFRNVAKYNNLTVRITGTSTSRTVLFYSKDATGTLFPISGVNTNGFATAISTTGTGEEWEFSIAGKFEVVMKLNAISGGNVTIEGFASV
jgi:hypothetical protein